MPHVMLDFPDEALHQSHGLLFRLGDITYDLQIESVKEAIEQLADKDFQGQITVKLHRSVHGLGRLIHIEVHALSLEVEPRYVQLIDFSDTVQVHKFERRIILAALRGTLEKLRK
ncbi:hypothetical protein WELLINGTON_70 [Erwinia phage Wellington]|uniref:Uncharacterized protein n=1 Tax=Erwinia phage Wellington TaxID=2267653 RepID=A0A345BL79_9CAUD|nr:hypothetical protein HOT70_gp231 [Erwinia phage Wellington]AXF51200.1 hypothetical protein WELLINGTON_70 [Erwinia phage Wellington]